ncbi:hypothetical protein [Streptomyces sp. NBC_01465]|uniref:hypothetical protein n=1 Tax=Streptomyces sp. NBC_01465 TaxID=2903878 RepID=UPI002E362417|nr:hypothetical protein [Streptomyces sp. NBC_01465]
MLAEPLRVTVDGVVTVDQTNNLTGTERQIAGLANLVGPDETTTVAGDDVPELVAVPLVPARRRR